MGSKKGKKMKVWEFFAQEKQTVFNLTKAFSYPTPYIRPYPFMRPVLAKHEYKGKTEKCRVKSVEDPVLAKFHTKLMIPSAQTDIFHVAEIRAVFSLHAYYGT